MPADKKGPAKGGGAKLNRRSRKYAPQERRTRANKIRRIERDLAALRVLPDSPGRRQQIEALMVALAGHRGGV